MKAVVSLRCISNRMPICCIYVLDVLFSLVDLCDLEGDTDSVVVVIVVSCCCY